MSAAELRQAAETLRARARAATPGPWVSDPAGAWTGRVFGTGVDGAGTEMVAKTSTNVPDDHRDATYIATMHPGVGLALADLLDETAETWSLMGTPEMVADEANEFIGLAHLINGGAA